jgi:hypothetical protein
MRRKHLKDVKQLWAKQLTDNEKIILAGINAKYSIDNVDKGTFLLKELQDDLALNTARFKDYTPDARIIAHLRTRAKEFNSELPSLLNKILDTPWPRENSRNTNTFSPMMSRVIPSLMMRISLSCI